MKKFRVFFTTTTKYFYDVIAEDEFTAAGIVENNKVDVRSAMVIPSKNRVEVFFVEQVGFKDGE